MTTMNFASIPALKGFFQCLETSGNILNCSCSNLVWDINGSGYDLIYDTASGGIGITMDFASPVIPFTEGSECPPVDTDLCYAWMCAGRLTGDSFFRFSVGDINQSLPQYLGIGSGMGMSDAPFHAAIGNHGEGNSIFCQGNENLRDYAIIHGPTDIIIFVKYDGVNNTLAYTAYEMENGSVILDADFSNNFTAVLPTLQFNPCFRFCGIEIYGAQLWEFTSFPSDILDGFLWQGRRWKLGRSYRDVYPAWAGTSGGVGLSIY